jgi:hypothetical protein
MNYDNNNPKGLPSVSFIRKLAATGEMGCATLRRSLRQEREEKTLPLAFVFCMPMTLTHSPLCCISLSVWIDSVNGERASVTQSTSTADTGDGRAAQLGMNIERFLLLLFRFPELRPGLRIIHAVVGVK